MNNFIRASLFLSFTVFCCCLIWIFSHIGIHGFQGISLDFLIKPPVDAGRAGGIAPIILSTLYVLGLTLIMTFPIGVATALWLSEFAQDNVFNKLLQLIIYVLAGVPSIVYGLFGNAFFTEFLGLGYSILSGSLTLAIMVLPFFIQLLWTGFSQIDPDLKKQAQALHLSQKTYIFNVLLPNTKPALIAGLILSIGRACAETAALLFTSGFVDRYPESIFDSGKTLTIHIYDLSMNVTGGETNAYATAFILMMIILSFNSIARLIIKPRSVKQHQDSFHALYQST